MKNNTYLKIESERTPAISYEELEVMLEIIHGQKNGMEFTDCTRDKLIKVLKHYEQHRMII